jgi:4-amino-4-deoxy-L-arabinose transferase-like glycosyltransferase
MSETRHFGPSDFLWLLLVVALAAALRGGYLVACATSGLTDGQWYIQGPPPLLAGLPAGTVMRGRDPPSELDALVHNLKEHGWFGSLAPLARAEEQTVHVAPGYPWLVSLAARLPFDTDQAVRWAQVGLGALTAGLYFLLALRAFASRLVAVLAGLLCALYPLWIVNVSELNDGVLTSFLLAATLWLGTRAGQSGGPVTSLLYGLSLAGLALVRAALLPLAFIALLWLLFRCRTLSRGWLYALLAFLGFVNGLLPWTLRNYRLTEDVLPVVDSTYYHLWMGHNGLATGGELPEHEMIQVLANARNEEPRIVAERLAAMSQNERYRELAVDVWQRVRVDPAWSLERRLDAGVCFLLGEHWLRKGGLWENASPGETRAPEWLRNLWPAAVPAFLLGMFLFGLLGWRWTYAWRERAALLAVAAVWLPLPYLLAHAEALHGPRLPLDGVLLTFAAFALAGLLPYLGKALRQGPTPETEAEP